MNPIRPSKGTRVILVDRPGSVQSSIVVGQPGFQATDPDYISMLALNHVLGGAVSSRLNTNLREKHGYTYGIFSGLDLRPGAGAFQIQSDVRTNAGLSSFTVRTPHCCMAARVSTRMISSTRSTPGWPNAPNPHK